MADNNFRRAAPPALPTPPREYSAGAFEQFNNVLRLYFNQISADIRTLMTTSNYSLYPWLNVARGLDSGFADTKVIGRNDSVGTSYVPICMGGKYQTPTSATAVRIKAGGNANDTAAGSGARAVTVVGLDSSFAAATEVIATAGASASSYTSGTWTRVFEAYVSSSGSYATQSAGSHSGDITLEDSSANVWAVIDSTDFAKGESEIGAYTIADGKTGYVFLSNVVVDSGATLDLAFFQREDADDVSTPYTPMRIKSVLTGIQAGAMPDFSSRTVPLGPFTGPCDIGFLGKFASSTSSVSVEFEVVEVT